MSFKCYVASSMVGEDVEAVHAALRSVGFHIQGPVEIHGADCGLFVLPTTHAMTMEAGYLAGRGKPIAVWGPPCEQREAMWPFAVGRLRPDVPLEDVAVTLRTICEERQRR